MVGYSSSEKRIDYAPPILGNGEIALQLDYMGQMAFVPTELDPEEPELKPSRTHASNFVWWAGRRYMYDMRRFLIPFGSLRMNIDGLKDRPESWDQTLDTYGAKEQSRCQYEDGQSIETEAFVHHDINLLSIRRNFHLNSKHTVEFSYLLANNRPSVDESILPRYMNIQPEFEPVLNGWKIRYSVCGQKDYEGVIYFFADHPLSPSHQNNRLSLTGSIGQESITFYLLFCDNQDTTDYEKLALSWAQKVAGSGYDQLYEEHAKKWADYYKESNVEIADRKLTQTYEAALYDIKTYTGKWSIPVGLTDASWEGKFFAYDEYFPFIGLLTGNHRELAGRVPRFRRAGLDQAIQRMSSNGLKVKEARYFWETTETGEEAAIPGYWYEHVFHMANVSVGAWEYFAYTQDRQYLKESAWPVMRACSEFYLRHMVYHIEGGKTIIGRCTDWERLGASVQNAYMTTVSVIRTLQLTVQAARILGEDPEFIQEAVEIGAQLMRDLPNDGEKYIPHPGCTQKSIGVFGGMFPYLVMKEDNPLQLNAIQDYRKYEGTYGNMYAIGGGVSSWFAAWKSITYSRMHRPEDAWANLMQAIVSAGCFGELFEINEKKTIYRPWFTTANGIFLEAVHSILIQSETGIIDLLPGWPQQQGDVAFTLPAEGDILVSFRLENGKITQLKLSKGENCSLDEIRIRIPAWLKPVEASAEGLRILW